MGGVRVLAAAAVVVLLGGAAAARAADPVLTADVGSNDSFNISLDDPGGAKVTHLDPGTYTLVVHDRSSFHNFHLSGPGVDVATDPDFVGDKSFTVTLVDGTYFFQCDPHSSQMKGKFTVGAVSEPAAPVKLAASIGPGAKFALKPAAGLAAGKYAITVADRSATDGFRLKGPGVSKATGVRFKGTVTWTVTLRTGSYSVGSVKRAGLRRTISVS
jgi:plastocyanin